MTTDDLWIQFRGQMPVCAQWAYFDHAAVAPLSGPASRILNEWSTDTATNGAVNWSEWRKRVEQTRRRAARLLNANESEVALIRNTTEGVSLVAEGWRWHDGDNVVVFGDEFPSNLYPWQNLGSRGVEVRVLDETEPLRKLDAAVEASDSRTRIVSISWVDYANGSRQPLDAWADRVHARGALLFVDAIQGLGVFPLDVRAAGIDFLAADGHKWLLGPEGAGILHVRSEHLERLRPLGLGWNSVQHAGDYSNPDLTLKPGAGRYEGGSYNMGGIASLGASLELLAGSDPQTRANRLLDVVGELNDRLSSLGANVVSPTDPHCASGIVSIEFPDRNPQMLRKHCLREGVVLNCRAGRLRISPHVYTNKDDLDRLSDALRHY